MHDAKLEYDGNTAVLKLTSHFGQPLSIRCFKEDAESFRLSFTGANEILVRKGIITQVFEKALAVDIRGCEVRVDRVSDDAFEIGEEIFVTEYYGLYMEHARPGFLASRSPIQEPRLLFVNVDRLDGGGNMISRYRVSPYDGSYRLMSNASV